MKTLLLMAAMAAQLPAQEFTVASIHPAKDDGSHDSDTDAGLYRVHNLTLKRLIATAYGVDMAAISGGPNWLDSEGFDITAKIPAEFVSAKPSRLPEMLQALLAERFHLAIHREPRQVSGLALVVSKKGPRMEKAMPDAEGSSTKSNGKHLSAVNLSMDQFAVRLSRDRSIGQMVVDKTGLTARYNFELDLTPGDTPDDLPPIFRALQEQLGLKLEAAKVPIEAVVIDHAERPEGN